jgi:hypothetical protein
MARIVPARYELDVQSAVQRLVDANFPGVRVEHNVRRKGRSGAEHQFDIWYEFDAGPVRVHVAGEAKRRSRAIEKGQVLTFLGMLNDLAERPLGLMVSEHGFQAGAEKVALTNGIALYVLSATPGRYRVLKKNPGEFFEGLLLNLGYVNGDTLDEALLAAMVDCAREATQWVRTKPSRQDARPARPAYWAGRWVRRMWFRWRQRDG